MSQINLRVKKIELLKEVDPDFSDEFLDEEAIGFNVTVIRHDDNYTYSFILLAPDFEDDGEITKIIEDVLFLFLDTNESYVLKDMTENDLFLLDSNRNYPILKFHPDSILDDKISFYWHTPPTHLMH